MKNLHENTSSKKIPTIIISGFLGSGKTSLIKNLLIHKNINSRWLIVVNEFGTIGFDQNELSGSTKDHILAIAGGCICCASKLTLQVNLVRALNKENYDLVIIEPTGLGHLSEIKNIILTQFKDNLMIEKTMTLIDAKKLKDSRYIDLELFYNQIVNADIIIANKVDTYDQIDMDNLHQFLKAKNFVGEIIKTSFGKISIEILEKHLNSIKNSIQFLPIKKQIDEIESFETNEFYDGTIKYTLDGSMISFKSNKSFNYTLFLLEITKMSIDRLKGYLLIDNHIKSIQYDGQYFDINDTTYNAELFLEIISLDQLQLNEVISRLSSCIEN